MTNANSDKYQTDWMANLDDNVTIDQLSIPGTHDSGTKDVPDELKGLARTQNSDIIKQLQNGIRFLDIRVSNSDPNSDDPLKVKHGIVSANLTFRQVLQWCQSFLNEHPSETILMLMNDAEEKNESSIENGFNKYLQDEKIKELFWLKPIIPKLGELRGKVVLFRRFFSQNREEMGIDLQDNWKDNEKFEITTNHGVKFRIQDKYKEHDTHKKDKLVKNYLDSAISNPNDKIIYINYNSISTNIPKGTHTPYQYAWGGFLINPAMNPSLRSYLIDKLKKGNKKRFGIIMLDFYDNQGNDNTIVDLIIKSNHLVRDNARETLI